MSDYVSAPQQGAARILQGLQWCRNGRYPDSLFQSRLNEGLNHLGHWRLKQLAAFGQWTNAIPASDAGASRTRWRAHVHTSPFAQYLVCVMVLAPTTNTNATSPGGQVSIEIAPLTFENGDYNYGASNGTPVDAPDTFGNGTTIVGTSGVPYEVSPDTDYAVTFTDRYRGRLVSATLFEWSLAPTVQNGYVQTGFAQGTPIYDRDRYEATLLARELWKHQAGSLWQWASDTDSASPTRVSGTGINILDDTSTTVSAATPGVTLDFTNRTTVSRASTGVPCVFAARGSVAAGTTGFVELKDSTGAVVATCSGFTTTEGWITTTCNLPASVAKYDVHFRSNGVTTLTVRAFSLYQYLA